MSTVLTTVENKVLTIQLNRPEKKNALTSEMYGAFSDALEHAAASDEVHAVVVTGSGDSFCAGNDLRDFLSGPADITGPSPQARLISNFVTFPKPFIAAINGVTVGIGVTMLLHCDLVYAAPNARLTTAFTNIGVVPEAGSTRLLAQRVGALHASALMLLADLISAQEAQRIGLVNEVVDDVLEYAQSKAAQLAAKSLDSIVTTKALLRNDHGTLVDQIHRENVEFSRLLKSDAFQAAASKLVR